VGGPYEEGWGAGGKKPTIGQGTKSGTASGVGKKEVYAAYNKVRARSSLDLTVLITSYQLTHTHSPTARCILRCLQ